FCGIHKIAHTLFWQKTAHKDEPHWRSNRWAEGVAFQAYADTAQHCRFRNFGAETLEVLLVAFVQHEHFVGMRQADAEQCRHNPAKDAFFEFVAVRLARKYPAEPLNFGHPSCYACQFGGQGSVNCGLGEVAVTQGNRTLLEKPV